MKNPISIICLILTILALLIAGFHGYTKEEQRKELLRKDSIMFESFNRQILKIDSITRELKEKDSLQDIKIQSFKKKVAITKRKYEENSGNMPVLPDFQ